MSVLEAAFEVRVHASFQRASSAEKPQRSAILEDLERAMGFEPTTPTLADLLGEFSE